MASRRPERVGALLRDELARMLVEGRVKDPRLDAGITVTAARVSPDLRNVTFLVSTFGSPETHAGVIEALRHAAPHLRGELTRRLGLRYAPELAFRYDHSAEYGAEIERLLGPGEPDRS